MSTLPGTSGGSWWGRSWLEAVEGSEATDPSRLRQGRALARRGAVRRIEVLPGHLSATVVDRTGELLEVTIGVRQLAAAEWDQVAEAVGARAAHLAALLDGELDPGVVDDAAAVDVQLLPGPSTLTPDCPCGDRSEPCAHAAAAAYVAAAEIDRDPFALFRLRGIEREDLLGRVRGGRRPEDTAEESAATRPGVDALAAWAGRSLDAVLREVPTEGSRRAELPAQPGRYVPWTPELPDRRIDPSAIDELGRDAVARAWGVLATGAPSGLRSPARADLARRAGARPELVDELAAMAGLTPRRLREWAEAWRLGGDEAVAVLADHSSWSTEQDVLAAAREQLVEMGVPRRSVALNYDSLGMAASTWLVLGADRRWYRLQGPTRHQDLRLVAPPSPDVRDLVEHPPS